MRKKKKEERKRMGMGSGHHLSAFVQALVPWVKGTEAEFRAMEPSK